MDKNSNDVTGLLVPGISYIISGALPLFPLIFVAALGDHIITLAIIPFIIASLSPFIKGILMVIQAVNMKKLLSGNYASSELEQIQNHINTADKLIPWADSLYLIGFFTFWFGFLIIFDYNAITTWNEGGGGMFYGSFIFWIAGLYALYKSIKDNRNSKRGKDEK